MAERTSFSSGGRLQTSDYWPTGKTTAAPFPATWIPVLLTILMVFVAIWTWLVLRDGLRRHFIPALPYASMSESILEDGQGGPHQAAFGQSHAPLATGFSPQVLYWSNAITSWSVDYDLDPNLVALVMQIESCGYASARSSAGAVGLFQVMPFHFQPDEDPYDPDVNAKRGLAYFAAALKLADGQLDLALAGYNGGHAVIGRDAGSWSEETKRYVSWGVGIYSEITQGYTEPPTLQAWLLAGGDRLCRLAAQTQDHRATRGSDLSLD